MTTNHLKMEVWPASETSCIKYTSDNGRHDIKYSETGRNIVQAGKHEISTVF
jgi:hypothetical protein